MKDEDWEHLTIELKKLGWKIEEKEVVKAYLISKDYLLENEEKELNKFIRQRNFHTAARLMEKYFYWPQEVRDRMKLER